MPFATARDGARIAYDVTGAGPPLLLVPGQACDRSLWATTREALAPHHQVIVFDHRDTGASDDGDADDDAHDGAYSTRGFARDAVAVLDAAGVRRAHVYGMSMGGRIAQWLAIEHAARVGALVLGCTTPGNAHGVARPAEADRVLASGDLHRLVPYLVSPAWADAHPDVVDVWLTARPVSPAARRRHYLASEAHEAWDRLPAITAPTLIVHGVDDEINVAANARLLAERIPAAALHLIAGARHAYFWDHADETHAHVREFLRTHPITA